MAVHDKEILNSIKFKLKNHFEPMKDVRPQQGNLENWKQDMLGLIQIWNKDHPEDLIVVKDPINFDEQALLARIETLIEKFGK